MSQYPPASPEPGASYGGQPQGSGAREPAESRTVSVALPVSVPYVTYAIIGITVAIFLLQMASAWLYGYVDGTSRSDLQQVIGDYIRGGNPLDWLEALGAQIKMAILAGQLWRFLTPVLLHASIPHILFNMWALYAFGAGLERSFGHGRFLALYILTGFSGNVLSFLRSPGPSVGASTAIFGLVAAEGIFLYQNRRLLGSRFRSAIGNILFIVAVNLGLGLTPGIDIWGHVGGLIGGLLFAWFAGPVWELGGTMSAPELHDRREFRDVLTGAAAVILVFGALAVWGMLAPIAQG